MGTDLKDLVVYQKAVELAEAVWQIVMHWDRFAKNTIGEQSVRAADSVGANVAESHGRFHFGEKLQFLYYARGSLYETRHWLRLGYKRGLIDQESAQKLAQLIEPLAISLNSFISSIKKQRERNHGVSESPSPYDTVSQNSQSQISNLEQEQAFSLEEIVWLTNLPANGF